MNQFVEINKVDFDCQKLLTTFPQSYFTVLLGFEKEHNIIPFPPTVDPFGINGERYMKQIAHRLTTGKYQYPKIDPNTKYTIMPVADGIRFCSFKEMTIVLDYLGLGEKEIKLLEEDDAYIDIETIEDGEEEAYNPAFNLDEQKYGEDLDEDIFAYFHKEMERKDFEEYLLEKEAQEEFNNEFNCHYCSYYDH